MGIQPNYAVLDPTALGPALEIRDSGLVLTCSVANTNNARKARLTLPKTTGKLQFEAGWYGNGIPGGLLAVGICTASSTLSAAVGTDASSYGLRPDTGGIYQGNTLLLATAAVPAQTYIQVCVDLVASTLSFYANGLLGTVSISPATGGRIYYGCASVGADNGTLAGQGAYGLNWYINAGLRTFNSAIAGYSAWFSLPPQPTPIYVCATQEGGYSSGAFDVPANQNFDPVVLNLDDFEVDKQASCYLWTDRSESSTYSTIDIDNSSGRYTTLREQDYRDQLVYASQMTTPNDTLANAAHVVATMVVDHIEFEGEYLIHVYVRDKMASLERPLQRRAFPPWVNAGIADRPYPIVIGAVRNVDVGAFLYDQANRLYQLSDSKIMNIGVLRDGGEPLDPNSPALQYTPTGDSWGVNLQTLPVKKLTGDISSCGTQNGTPAVPDVLAGSGDWTTTWTTAATAPPNWTLTNTLTTYTGSVVKWGAAQGYPLTMARMTSNQPYSAIAGGAELSLKTTPTVLRAGKSYRISFVLWSVQQGGGVNGGLVLLSAYVRNSGSAITPLNQPLTFGSNNATDRQQVVYTVPPGADRQLYATVVGDGNFPGTSTTALFGDFIVEEMAETAADIPLIGTGFYDIMNTTLTNHAGLDPSEWSASDCLALDAAYPMPLGGPLGLYIPDAATVSSAARLPMDSVCGTVQTDRLAVMRFRRLVDPINATPIATYDQDTIDYPLVATPDYAPGLTQTYGVRRNAYQMEDSDFVSDYLTVPAELRTRLKRSSQYLIANNAQLRNSYLFAASAGQLDTLFDDIATATSELARVVYPFTYQRLFAPVKVVFTINYTGIPPDYLFGDVLAINYTSRLGTRFAFTFQRNVAVIGARLMLGRQKIEITAWG